MELYDNLAWCFDLISTGEDHEKEADFIRTTVETHNRSDGNRLLDVCCGHGWHDHFLKKDFEITGVDLNETVLDMARKRNPEIEYVSGDVRDFDLGERFDVVMCFDALEHLLTYEELKFSLDCLQRHLASGGVLIFHLDRLRETYGQFKLVSSGQRSMGDTHLAYLDLEYDVDPNDTVAEGCMVFLVKEEGKDLDVHLLEAKTGLFELAEISRILDAMGLKTSLYDGDFHGGEYTGESPFPVFACMR
jgi:SAM-dependent methyltransferase